MKKPKLMKPKKAWAVVHERDGAIQIEPCCAYSISPRRRFLTKRWPDGLRIARVIVTEVER